LALAVPAVAGIHGFNSARVEAVHNFAALAATGPFFAHIVPPGVRPAIERICSKWAAIAENTSVQSLPRLRLNMVIEEHQKEVRDHEDMLEALMQELQSRKPQF